MKGLLFITLFYSAFVFSQSDLDKNIKIIEDFNYNERFIKHLSLNRLFIDVAKDSVTIKKEAFYDYKNEINYRFTKSQITKVEFIIFSREALKETKQEEWMVVATIYSEDFGIEKKTTTTKLFKKSKQDLRISQFSLLNANKYFKKKESVKYIRSCVKVFGLEGKYYIKKMNQNIYLKLEDL